MTSRRIESVLTPEAIATRTRIRERVIEECVKRLKAADCRFHIVDSDGVEYGEPLAKKITRRPSSGPVNHQMFIDKLGGLEVGGVAVLTMQEGDTLDRLARNASAWIANRWGAGNGQTLRGKDGLTVEIMRIG